MPERRRSRKSDDGGARARAFWSGTITFGLVSIPVDLFPANRKERVSLRMLAPDGTPLSRRYYCPEHEREIPWSDIVRGYEVDGEWVVLTDEELEAASPRRSRDIDLRLFADRSGIDPIYFERAYYLAPSGESTKAYRLLAGTMERTGRVGVATFVMRAKEYVVAIVAENGLLRAETMRFADEVRSADDIGLPDTPRPKAAAVRKLRAAISKLKKSDIALSELEDRNARRLLEIVERKRKQGDDVVEIPEAVREEAGEEEQEDGVIDLMEVLKRRMAGETPRQARKPGPRTSRRTGSADDLDSLSKKELYGRAKKQDIEGRSSMSKEQLIEALRRSA